MSVLFVFQRCVEAISSGELINRESAKDKEFHFQNWFRDRLDGAPFHYQQGGRNTYPDFSIVEETDGYEVKGLAYPGRDASFDSNSQAPTGFHNGRTVYYVFGRYPKKPDGDTYPVLDLVLCHGDFLNADHDYVHENRNVKGFGSYGDIMIRDRKMYVVPTPFHLVEGTAHHQTLILPSDAKLRDPFFNVGTLTRVESDELIVGYSFKLKTNEIIAEKVANPGAGKEHTFRAWRLKGSNREKVSMRKIDPAKLEVEPDDEADE